MNEHGCGSSLLALAVVCQLLLSGSFLGQPAFASAHGKDTTASPSDSPEESVPDSVVPSSSTPVPSASSPAPTASPPEPSASPPEPSASSPAPTASPSGPTALPAPLGLPPRLGLPARVSPPANQDSQASDQSTSNALAPIRLSDYQPQSIQHEKAKTLNLNPVYLSRTIEMSSFNALRNESAVSQEITLREAINYVLDQGMQIKVSRESMNYQHYLTLAGIAGFVPSFSMQYNLMYANVFNQQTTSLARTFLTGVSFPVFQGGSVLYSLLGQRYREKAWREAYKATVSDVFLDVYQKYTNLVLQRVLLQTWAKAVEADEEQLKTANVRYTSGTGTRLEIMQVEALLSGDKQSFLQQGVTMRQAGLALNLALNYPLSINLIPAEQTLTEAPLFSEHLQLRTLLRDALRFNPGLRQYENFRLSAARNIQAQSASLYPSVAFFILYQINDATVSPPANGFALGGAATSAIDSFLDSTFAGRVSNNALGQQFTFSPTAGPTSTQGANTGPSATPAAAGGTPIAQIQSGSLVSSGAVAPSIFGGGNGASSGPNVNGSLQAPAGIFPGFFREVQAGISLNWSLPSLGLTTTANIVASKVLARQALMQCNQELSLVAQQVRGDYLGFLATRESIDKAAASTAATQESLRYAQARLANGVATELELLRAQHDYIAALTSQAQAIVASNVAQAQLLHDMGMISATTLTTGYQPGEFVPTAPTGAKRWFKP
jgi:outer membrane protein TolC